jgi:ketosteroid isomerase-like protein
MAPRARDRGRSRIIGDVSAEAVRVVEEIQQVLTADDVVTALSDEGNQTVRRLFMELAEPDFEVVMLGPEYSSARLDFVGLDGFVAAWRDWTRAFESFRIEVDEMVDAGDNVVSLVRQIGIPRGAHAEMETPGAAVWMIRDGRLRRVEFHLDRDAALRAAGIDPSSLS